MTPYQVPRSYGMYSHPLNERMLVSLDSGTPLDRNAHQFKGSRLGGALVAGKDLDIQLTAGWTLAAPTVGAAGT